MPILPENKKRYPANWKTEIRPRILERANHCCENCGVPDKSLLVYRNNKLDDIVKPTDFVYDLHKNDGGKTWTTYEDGKLVRYRLALVVLTIAHLDHTPENCNDDNLRAWCQKCHNSYDAKHRAETRSKNAKV